MLPDGSGRLWTCSAHNITYDDGCMFEELVALIMQRLTQQAEVVVAKSGHGGSGKSTLAERLGRRFGVLENQILRMDGLYAENYLRAKDILVSTTGQHSCIYCRIFAPVTA
jgi:hypothetical protein